MKLDTTTLNFIRRVIKCASLGGIANVSIEPGLIRGMDDNQIVIMFHTDNVPDFEFGSIGLNRLSAFTSRLDLALSAGTAKVTAVTATDKSDKLFVRSLLMEGKGVKIDYRCANPAVIRAPRQRLDNIQHEVTISADALAFMVKGMAAMGSDEVKFTSDVAGETTFSLSDVNGDNLTYTLPDASYDIVNDVPAQFECTYPIKTLLPLLKATPDPKVYITDQNGQMRVTVEGFDMYVFPRSQV